MNKQVMSRANLALSLILFGLYAASARAQLDSSSAVLLRSSGKTSSPRALDSSRYKIRAPETRKDGDDDIEEKAGTYIPSPVPAKPARIKTPARNVEIINIQQETQVTPDVPSPVTAPPTATVPQAPAAETPVVSPPVSEQMKELFLGRDEDIDEYRKAVHPQDPRANIIEISLAPAYFYNGSQSSYQFHDYNTQGTGFGLGMNLWLTPFFGLHSDFFSSVSASIRSAGTNAVPLDRQDFNAGFRFRKHFGTHRKSPQLSWGLDYHDSRSKISKEATEAVGRHASGLSLSLEGVVPVSVGYAHTFKIDIRPRLHLSEMNTAVEVKSGSKNSTNSIGLSLGGQWTLDRKNQVFWRGQYSVEQSLFEGEASTVDPKSGTTPNGVSTTDSMLIFYFGVKWGS
jgi:hypothetical protein